MVLKLPAIGNTLTATPFFDILGFKVMASWPGSDKACPRCKLVGHDSRSCPRRPASTKSSTVDAADTVTAAVAALTSDPSTSTAAVITSDIPADVDMVDASTSATVSS